MSTLVPLLVLPERRWSLLAVISTLLGTASCAYITAYPDILLQPDARMTERMEEGRSRKAGPRRDGGGGGATKWQGTDMLPVLGLCLLLLAAWLSPKSGSTLLSWSQPTTHHLFEDELIGSEHVTAGGMDTRGSSSSSGGSSSGSGGSGNGASAPSGAKASSGSPDGGSSLVAGLGQCSNATCGEVLGIPRVALLFLTPGQLPHEAMWRLWLEGVVGFMPLQRLPLAQQAACGSDAGAWRRLLCACSPHLSHPRVHGLAGQYMYSLYVHPPPWPDFKGFPPDNLFSGRVIPGRARASWGHISMVDAARALLAAALADPLNERFVLISETGIPLYDPLTFYQQLLHDHKSHVQACEGPQASPPPKGLWKKEMETTRLKQRHLRRSSRFFALTRHHAELAVADKEVYNAFSAHCSSPECGGLPDEHYLPTLLAALGEGNNTHCEGSGVAWQELAGPPGAAHARNFTAGQVSQDLLQRMRGKCAAAATLAVRDAFRTTTSLGAHLAVSPDREAACSKLQNISQQGPTFAHPLPGHCHLTARKFPRDTAAAVQKLLFLGSCQAIGARFPPLLSDEEAEQDRSGYLLNGRACAVARQKGLLQ